MCVYKVKPFVHPFSNERKWFLLSETKISKILMSKSEVLYRMMIILTFERWSEFSIARNWEFKILPFVTERLVYLSKFSGFLTSCLDNPLI